MSGRGRTVLAARLLALLAVAAQPATAGAGGPVLENATPDAVREGDAMTLTGAGFRPRAEDHRAFLGGGGAAVWAEVVAATPDELEVEVGPVPAEGVETLTLWTGQSFALPDAVLAVEGRVYLVTGASWFVAATATGGPPIALVEASPEAAGGRLEGGTVRVPVPPPPPDPPPCVPGEEGGFGCFEIEIKVIATPDPGTPPPDPPLAERAAAAAGPGVAAALSMRLMAGPPAPDPDAFAADLAQALARTFGPLGLAAEAEGAEVAISYGGGLGAGSSAVVARVPRDGSAP